MCAFLPVLTSMNRAMTPRWARLGVMLIVRSVMLTLMVTIGGGAVVCGPVAARLSHENERRDRRHCQHAEPQLHGR